MLLRKLLTHRIQFVKQAILQIIPGFDLPKTSLQFTTVSHDVLTAFLSRLSLESHEDCYRSCLDNIGLLNS